MHKEKARKARRWIWLGVPYLALSLIVAFGDVMAGHLLWMIVPLVDAGIGMAFIVKGRRDLAQARKPDHAYIRSLEKELGIGQPAITAKAPERPLDPRVWGASVGARIGAASGEVVPVALGALVGFLAVDRLTRK